MVVSGIWVSKYHKIGDDKDLKLRGHHILCISCGLGKYGSLEGLRPPEVRDLEPNSTLILKIVDECDVICSECPDMERGKCLKHPGSDEEVKEMDRLVLKKLGLSSGDEIVAKDIFSFIKERLQPGEVIEICSGRHHSWPVEECAEGLQRFKEI